MLWPSSRQEFGGAEIRIPVVGWVVPGALAICVAGLAVVMLAAVVDDAWHSQLTFIGLVACRLALADRGLPGPGHPARVAARRARLSAVEPQLPTSSSGFAPPEPRLESGPHGAVA